MENLQTSPELLARMRAAASSPSSEDDLYRQRISFIMGAVNADNNITKEDIEHVLAQHEGRKIAPK